MPALEIYSAYDSFCILSENLYQLNLQIAHSALDNDNTILDKTRQVQAAALAIRPYTDRYYLEQFVMQYGSHAQTLYGRISTLSHLYHTLQWKIPLSPTVLEVGRQLIDFSDYLERELRII